MPCFDRVALGCILLASLAVTAMPAVAANAVFFAQPGQSEPAEAIPVTAGVPLTLDLRMDFIDTTVGGMVGLVADPALLALESVVFDPALGDSDALRCPPQPAAPPPARCPGSGALVSFGTLEGLAGARRIATVTWMPVSDGVAGPAPVMARAFSDTRGRPLDVSFVPEPAPTVLLAAGSALLGPIGAFRRRRGRARGRLARGRG